MEGNSMKIGHLSAEPGSLTRGFIKAGETATGPVEMPVVIINGKRSGPALSLTAGVHATEYAPIEAALRVIRQLTPKNLCGAVVVIPVVSMHMFAGRCGFVSPIDGLNLNKIAPGGDGSISEILVRTLLDDVITKCQYHIDLHAGDLGEMLWKFAGGVLTGQAQLDRETETLARLYSPRLVCLSADGASLPPFAGSIVRCAADQGIVSILAESGGNGTLEEQDVRVHMEGIWNVMRYLKMIDGEPKIPRSQISATGRAITRATRAGLLRLHVAVGDTILDGQLVGEVIDVFGQTVEEIKVVKGGIAGLIWAHKTVSTGDPVIRCWYTKPAAPFPNTDRFVSSAGKGRSPAIRP
jgi:predicted deacylase